MPGAALILPPHAMTWAGATEAPSPYRQNSEGEFVRRCAAGVAATIGDRDASAVGLGARCERDAPSNNPIRTLALACEYCGQERGGANSFPVSVTPAPVFRLSG